MNRHTRRRPRPRVAETELTASVAIASSLRGCNCQPDVARRHPGGIQVIEVMHGRTCPAADTGHQLLLKKGDHQTIDEFADAITRAMRLLEEGAR